MPVKLRCEVDIEGRIQRRLRGMASPNEPVYEVVETLLRACSTAAGVDARGQAVGWFLDFCRDRDIEPLAATKKDIEDYLAQIRDLAVGTRRGRLSHVRALFVASGAGLLDPTRLVHVKAVKISRAPGLREEECLRLLNDIRADVRDPSTRIVGARDLLLHLLLMVLGPRRAAVARLAWQDFFLSEEGIEAVKTHDKKGKVHDLPMTPALIRARDQWRAVAEEAIGRPLGTGDAVFPGLSRRCPPLSQFFDELVEPMSPTGLAEIVKRRLVHAKVTGPKLGPHRLRTTAATQAYLNGADARDVMILLNHESLATTMIYIQGIDDLRIPAPHLNPMADYDIDGS